LPSVAGYTFDVNFSSIALSSNLADGESYWIRNASPNSLLVVNSPTGFINFFGNTNIGVAPFEIIEVKKKSSGVFEVDYINTNSLDNRIVYVSQTGNDLLGQKGNPDRPFKTILAALANTSGTVNTIHIKAGTYTISSTLSSALTEINYHMDPGVTISVADNVACFTLASTDKKVNVYGHGSFFLGTNSKLIFIDEPSSIYLEASKITANATNSRLVLSDALNGYAKIVCPIIEASAVNRIIEVAGDNNIYLTTRDAKLGKNCVYTGTNSTVSINVNDGTLRVHQSILDNASAATGATLKLNLINSTVLQEAPALATINDYLLKFNSINARISGINSTIEGTYLDKSVYYSTGAVLISGVKLINPIVVVGIGLTLDGISIFVDDLVDSIQATSPQTVYILKDCASNEAEDSTNITLVGGDLIVDTGFTL
jgi:hypothetical protein